jgi:hypothetical protein
LQAGWEQFEEAGWGHELPGWSGRLKISRRIAFLKNFVLSCLTRKDWTLRPGAGWKLAASQQVSNATLRRKQVSLPHNLA